MLASVLRGTLLLVLLVASEHFAAAADRFVSRSGSDAANDCLTSATPCGTLAHALTQASSGDVIKAASGQYLESLLIDYSTVLVLSGGWLPDFSSQDTPALSTVAVGTGSNLLQVEADAGDVIDLTVDRFAFRSADDAVSINSDGNGSLTISFQNCVLKKNAITTFVAYAAGTSTLDLSLSNCLLSRNRSLLAATLNLYSSGAGTLDVTLDDVSIERNLFSGAVPAAPALSVGAESTATASLVGTNVSVARNSRRSISIGSLDSASTAVTLTDSQIRDNRYGGILASGVGTTLDLVNGVVARNGSLSTLFALGAFRLVDGTYTFFNTTIRGNRSWCCTGGLEVFSGSIGLTNTIVWDNETTDGPADNVTIGSGGSVDADHSAIGPGVVGTLNDLGGNITTDPLFVTRRDVHLKPASPAVDSGTCVGAPTTDFEGDPRPSGGGCDMGADEVAP